MIENEVISGKSPRIMASILFKNCIYMGVSNGQQQNSNWFKLSDQDRAHIKQGLLSQLGGSEKVQKDQSLMKDLCLCISVIAAMEIPTGAWPDFIDTMSQ